MNNHLTTQQMLAYVDGELSRKETRNANKHLHSCWTCLAEMERLKGDIATILDAQNEVFAPALPSPPASWVGFDTLLARSSAALQQPSRWSHIVASWRGFLAPVRMAIISAVVATFAIGIYSMAHTRPVSAKEVLQKVQNADQLRSGISSGQVIRQRVHIRKTTRHQRTSTPVSLDTWKSPTATYWDIDNKDSIAADLQAQYQAHNVPMDLPLSAMSMVSWGHVIGGNPDVSQQGSDVDLSYAASSEDGATTVRRVSLLIQPQNWHIRQMTIDFSDVSFEVTEEEYAVVPTTEVPANLLAYLGPVTSPFAEPPAAHPFADIAISSLHAPLVNLDKAELDVFTTLHSLKADLGEPITITRSRQAIKVGLWQLQPERQNELRAALADKTGVQVDLIGPHLPLKKSALLKNNSQAESNSPPQIVHVESGDEDQRLTKYFGTSQKQQDFTNSALATSTAILSHLYALKNLQTQFPAGKSSSFSSNEQKQLDSLVRDHLIEISTSIDALGKQLKPLDAHFGVSACTSSTGAAPSTWQSGSLTSLETARAIDHELRALLTASQTPSSPDSALPQINQNLCNLHSQVSGVAAQINN